MNAIRNIDQDARGSSALSALFNRCVRFRTYADGRIECRCALGHWSVSASTREDAEREAKHYWIQYFRDGEYERHLSMLSTPGRSRLMVTNP